MALAALPALVCLVLLFCVTGWRSICSDLVLSTQVPVMAGSPVVLLPKPPPRTSAGLKSIVAVSHDKTCHTSHARHPASPTTDTNVIPTCHERSHCKADELHLSRLPSWRKRLLVQAEETALSPSGVDHQER